MKQLKSLLYITLLAQTYCFAQDAKPSAAEQAKFQELTQVYNTNDSVAYAKFYDGQLTDKSRLKHDVQQMLSEFRFAGKLRLKAIKHTSPTETVVTLQTLAYGSWVNFLWITDSAQHYKEHHMRPIRLGTDYLQTGVLSQKQILDSADKYIKNLVAQKVFAGNVIIAKNGNVLYKQSFGNYPATGKPNTIAGQMGLASMGKLFTTISILQLADKDKLKLDDSVGKLMPQLQNKALSGITIKQLLTHTSGMGDYFEDPAYDPMANKQFTNADILPSIEKDKPHFAPGKEFRYSNTGFLLLGLIVEKISGTDFKTYVQNNICKPAGMTATHPDAGAGGGTSTVTDIYNLSNALKANTLLKPATTAMFLNEHIGDWGLGQEYQQLGNEVITGHSGGFIGICTELNMYHNTGYTVVILSNTEPPFGHFLSDKIKELIIRK